MNTTQSARGAMPPTQKMLVHPKAGIRAAAMKPVSAEPRLKPIRASTVIVERLRRGLNSETRARAFGMAPPRPTPVEKTPDGELGQRMGGDAQKAEDSKTDGRTNDHRLASEPVGERPRDEGAEHQAE